MISIDEFHRTMTESFKEIRAKMDNLHTETMDKVEKIEEKLNILESSYNTHIQVGEALIKQKSKTKLTKVQKISIVLALLPIIVTIVVVFVI